MSFICVVILLKSKAVSVYSTHIIHIYLLYEYKFITHENCVSYGIYRVMCLSLMVRISRKNYCRIWIIRQFRFIIKFIDYDEISNRFTEEKCIIFDL